MHGTRPDPVIPIALARLNNEKTLKRGIKTKRLKADWDEKYRAKLLFDVV
jgi:hypothetical protein